MAGKKTIIIDYKLSNLFSVQQACRFVGIDAQISSEKEDIINADALILPGVGSFGDGMANLNQLDLTSPIKDFIAQDKPFLGVCLGMQLLFTESEEFGNHKGLDIISGQVKRIPESARDKKLRVPQIGWNTIHAPNKTKEWNHPIYEGIRQNEFMYFVHSLFTLPNDKSNSLSETDYDGFEYTSSVHKSNLVAFQFHPEKSGKEGIKIYKNWAKMIQS